MRKLNESSCLSLYTATEWSRPDIVMTLVILAFVSIMVILGNVLVIAAVYNNFKLRNVTNMFIVSLAVADFLVGIAVLPFSATWEVFKVWIFGDTWCSIWLAMDVWMCTASILNLCAISLDRYLAVTRPVKYPQIMSPKRARLLVTIVWVLSFIICFPPLIGWKDRKDDNVTYNVTFFDSKLNSTIITLPVKHCQWICELTNDPGYVLYSAFGSFYIPTLIMLFFYWRIYIAAISTTKAINRGFRTTKSSKVIDPRFDDQRLTLRMHKGRRSEYSESNINRDNIGLTKTHDATKRDRIRISISFPKTEMLNMKSEQSLQKSIRYLQSSIYYSKDQIEGQLFSSSKKDYLKDTNFSKINIIEKSKNNYCYNYKIRRDPILLSEIRTESNEDKRHIIKISKRNVKSQVKRIRMETRAAKTLGIVVGGFILCWLPFFTIYLIRAFYPNYIHPTIFSILFWLGYCNSAINPCIYALFSKDFRYAFKNIIYNNLGLQHINILHRTNDSNKFISK